MPTLDIAIAAGGDDGFVEVLAGSTWDGTADVIRVGNNGGSSIWNTWLRFINVIVPVGATIDVAYLTLDGQFAEGTTVESVIAGVDEDNHAAPTNFATWDTDHGIHTTATVQWDFAPGTISFQSPSIVTVIQEIIDRGSWASGNALGIHVDDDSSGDDNRINMESFEGAGTEPSLHIEYTEAATGGHAMAWKPMLRQGVEYPEWLMRKMRQSPSMAAALVHAWRRGTLKE